MSQHVSASVDDNIAERLEDAEESKSELIRRGLRKELLDEDDSDLSDQRRAAYAWLRERAGVGGNVRLEIAETVLSQELSIAMELVRDDVLRALDRKGYVDVKPRVRDVVIVVRGGQDE